LEELSTPSTPSKDSEKAATSNAARVASPGIASTSSLDIIVKRTRAAVPIRSSRRMCDLARFVEEIRSVERHTIECNQEGSLVHVKTIVRGMASVLVYVCSKVLCPAKVFVYTAKPEEVHLDSVEGNTAVGIGFSQAAELLAAMKSPYMSQPTYAKYEKQFGVILNDANKSQVFSSNIEEEKRLGIEAGDVDDNGNVHIAVIADGSWDMRSYGHGFNAKSGAACIIGRRTKRMLYSGVCNKYCHVCRLAENIPATLISRAN
jgi:hypothetical protein